MKTISGKDFARILERNSRFTTLGGNDYVSFTRCHSGQKALMFASQKHSHIGVVVRLVRLQRTAIVKNGTHYVILLATC